MDKIEGIHFPVAPEHMSQAGRRIRDFYAIKPGAHIIQTEFGYYVTDRWVQEGHIKSEGELWSGLGGFEDTGIAGLGGLGWCEAAFHPVFEEKVLEDRGEHELVQDFAGRHVLFFKGRRSGFMPEYESHPVKDVASWEENCEGRLDPDDPARYEGLEANLAGTIGRAKEGCVVQQGVAGGYMYLRSLIGPLELTYMFYDDPGLIHRCMRQWLLLADKVTAAHQKYVTIDELFLAEDICYKGGALISPEMMREFLFPYYQQLIANIKSRQLDPNRHLYVQVDTDGFAEDVIPLYQEIGLDYMSPFEVAAGCDVVRVGRQYPGLRIRGGIDKRVLATTTDEIDRELERIMPVMKARGGYMPCCDHGVPEEVSFENYMHYRKRMLEYAG